MVERGVTVDWFDARGGGGGREGMEEGGIEVEVGRRRGTEEWGRNGENEEEEEEGRRKKVRRGMAMMMKGKEELEKDAENAEDNMLELRLSLAVAISVSSPQQQQQQQQQQIVAPAPGSFVVHQHQSNHSHNHNGNQHQQKLQQQSGTAVGGRNQSPVKPLMARPSSPIENHRDLPRPNLTASLKHLVSQQQQQPVKVKSVARIPGGLVTGTARQPLQQYGVSPVPQLARPHPPLVHSSSSLQDGLDSGGLHFQGIGRLAPSAQAAAASQLSSVSLGQVGQRHQSAHLMNPTHESLFPKGFPHHNQSRHSSAQRIFSRTTSAGFLQQQSGGKELLTQQGQQQQQQLGSLGQSIVSSFSPSSRIFATGPCAPLFSAQTINLPVTGPQLQAFLQHHSSNSVSVASHRQTQPPVSTLGKNPSAFSVVRPAISGTIPFSIGGIPPRERSSDVHVVVNVCDRKVKLASDFDATSLYALCRRWVRNDVLRRDQSVVWDCPPLPRPLPAVAETGPSKIGSVGNSKKEEAARVSQVKLPGPVESMTEKELLQHHVEYFKNVRKRFRDDRMHRIARFMPRLALLLPVNAENS